MAEELRMQRIEDRLDRIGEAIERIARTEERVHAIMDYASRLDTRLERVEVDMQELKTLAIENAKAHKTNDWFFKTVFTAVVSASITAAAVRYFS